MAAIRISSSFATCLALCSLLVSPALAEERAGSSEASRHFERGYLMAQQGSLEEAIQEFQTAYALRPHASVLYNLGQAYAASGRAAEAMQTLSKYLAESDPKLDAERRAQATTLLDYQKQRVGTLVVEAEPAGAELVLDGVLLGRAPLANRVLLSAGIHGLWVNAPGRVAHYRRLEIRGGATLHVRVPLPPEPASTRSISCRVPDVSVEANGISLGRLPLGGRVSIPSGTSELRFERAGYAANALPLPADPSAVIDCGLVALDGSAELTPVAFDAPAHLVLEIDGQPFRRGALPSGRHLLALSGRGVVPTETLIEIGDSPRRRIITAKATTDSLSNERTKRRRWHLYSALASAGAGAAGLGMAGVLYAMNRDAYASWRADGTELAQRANAMPHSVGISDWDDLLRRENALRNRDSVALGSALLGSALLLTGAALWWTAPTEPTQNVHLKIGKAPWVGYSRSF
ncbi:MAG: hypothetical protein K0R38_2933 [Polyangiaceae bacterium]|jgi:hypothetical protein|nr:hypothetical protein [Polyangiaceae bacterium]